MEPAAEVAEALGLRLGRRLGGEWGAFLVRTPAGAPAVLKPLPRHELFSMSRVTTAIELATALHAEGYPLPRYLDVGMVGEQPYTLQEFRPGEMPERLETAHVRRLIELRRWHVGAAARAGQSSAEWRDALLAGLDPGGPQTRVVRERGDERALRLLDRAMQTGAAVNPSVLSGDDVLHGDFHHQNLLVRGAEIVAYVDWEGARAGDSRSDLLMLAFSAPDMQAITPGARRALLDEVATIPADVRALIAASYAVGKLHFALATRPEALDWAIATAKQIFGPD
jgi:hypothetical protein